MRMTYQTFISKNRHNNYQFRIVIPLAIRPLFNNKREIRRSLRTDSRSTAIYRARFMWVKFQEVFKSVSDNKKSEGNEIFSMGLMTHIDAFGDESTIDFNGNHELEIKHVNKLNKEKAELLLKNPQLRKQNKNTTPTSSKLAINQVSFDSVADSFLSAFKREKDVMSNTVDGYRASFQIFSIILNNANFDKLTKSDTNKCREQIYRLPKNLKSKKLNQAEITKLLCSDSNKYASISRDTAVKYLRHLKQLCQFAFDQEFNSVNLMDGVTLTSNKKPETKRLAFTDDDLTKLFSGHIFQKEKEKKQRYHPYQFWVPLLALYTGARLEEICQLTVNDLKFDKSSRIHYLRISDIEEDQEDIKKALKNESSRRRVPIHAQLQKLGFFDFIASRSKTKKTFLFDLNSGKRGKRGAAPSNWFNRDEIRKGEIRKDGTQGPDRHSQGYLLKSGVIKKGNGWAKTFHSFRHTFIDNLRQANIETSKIAALVGHEPEYKMTHSYGNEYNLQILKKVMDKLEYNLDTSHLNFDQFMRKVKL